MKSKVGDFLDELKWRTDSRIKKKTKEKSENFLLSAEVLSFKNVKNKKKKFRNLLLTKNYMYFISEFTLCMINSLTIKRRIPVIKFEKVTLSKDDRDCILHIKDEDDVFISSGSIDDDENKGFKKFKRILKEIDKAYTNQSSKNLPVFRINDFAQVDLKELMMSGKKKKKIATQKKAANEGQIFTEIGNEKSKTGEEPIYISYDCKQPKFKLLVTSKNFEEIKGLRSTKYFKEIVVKLQNEDKLFTLRKFEISKIEKMFKFDVDSLHDLIKNYMPISDYINDISLAFMNMKELSVYTPFLAGGKLSTYIKNRGYMQEDRAKSVLIQIINALDVLHDREISIGILNPCMIAFNSEGKVVLDIIWNIYKLKKQINTNYLEKDLLMYTAPETENLKITSVSDWWSLGTILYEMIYGFNPFYHQSIKFIKKLKLDGKVLFSKERKVSEECKDLILKLMKKNLRLRLGWKNGGNEIKNHPWFNGTKDPGQDEHAKIMSREFNDPLQLDYIDTDDVLLCKPLLLSQLDEAIESTRRNII